MHNPNLDKLYYTLPEAFNVLGSERYGEAWSGREIVARQLPDPDTILPVVEANRHDAGPLTVKLRDGLIGFANIMRAREQDRAKQRIAYLVRVTNLSREIVTAALDPTAYKAEFHAFQRRTSVEKKFCKLFYIGTVDAELMNRFDGIIVPIPKTNWGANMSNISFSEGSMEWTDRSSATTYNGVVLIKRSAFDRAMKTEADLQLKSKIEAVLHAAAKKRRKNKSLTSRRLATLIANEGSYGFSEETIRQILGGRYPALRRLGIRG